MLVLSNLDVVASHTLFGVDSITTLTDHGDRCGGVLDAKTLGDLALGKSLTVEH